MDTNFRDLLHDLASYAVCIRTGVDRAVYDEAGERILLCIADANLRKVQED
jgi:hypothetical protein